MPTEHRDRPHLNGGQLVLVDALIVVASATIALTLSLHDRNAAQPAAYVLAVAAPILVRPVANLRFGLYRRVWRHASIGEMLQIVMAVAAGSLVSIATVVLTGLALGMADPWFSRTYWMIEGLLSLALLGGVRFGVRATADGALTPNGMDAVHGVPTILYGAGSAGVIAVRTARHPRSGIHPVGFLDDDAELWGSRVADLEVRGGLDRLAQFAQETGARRLLLTMNNAPGGVLRRIVHEASRLGLEVHTIPHLHELFDGTLDAYKIRRVRVDDLLRRPQVTEHVEGVRDLVADRIVLVTGAGGSIGSELARQVYSLAPRQLVLVDRAEGPLYGIQRELELARHRAQGSGELSVHIANVVTRASMRRLMDHARPDVVFHAAAYKHVPMMEEHVADAVQVNVGGTLSLLDAAVAHRVPHFVLVSTDKAVRPTSVMGATKRVAEALVTDAARRTGLRYVAVRFGNVLGSSWSVVPIFQQQLENGDPLTITHPDMTRYFMTIPEAVWLILDAAAIGPPGSLMALDMGEPVRILDLATDLVRLSGLDPATVPIEYTGLRPGEKLHEQLFYADEHVQPTSSSRVMLASRVAELEGARSHARALLELADGEHDAELRDALFAVTDALEHAVPATTAEPARGPEGRLTPAPVVVTTGGGD